MILINDAVCHYRNGKGRNIGPLIKDQRAGLRGIMCIRQRFGGPGDVQGTAAGIRKIDRRATLRQRKAEGVRMTRLTM